MFKQFLPSEAEIKEQYESNRAHYEGSVEYKTFMVDLAAKEAKRLDTGGYLKFGPYWWALKAILNANGHYFGSSMDGLLASVYSVKDEEGGVDEALTITAAFEFRDYYLANLFIGTSQFELFDDGQFYFLQDDDMAAVA